MAWLGFAFALDLREGKFLVPEDKVVKLVKLIDGVLIGQVTCLRTRALYAVINSRQSWADRLPLLKEAREELAF